MARHRHGNTVNTSLDIHLSRTGVVTYRNHRRLGYERLCHGVYGHRPNTDALDDWAARRARFASHVHAVMAAYDKKPIALFGPTALQMLGVELPVSLQDWDNCHVIVPHDASHPRRKSVIAHRCRTWPGIWRSVEGLAVLHPVDHWLQLRHATDDELIEVGDGFLRRRHPLLTITQLTQRLSELHGVTGVARARQVVHWLAPDTDSLPETSTRLTLVHAGLDRPIVNCAIPCPAAGRTYHADMAYDKEKLAIEFDGAVHVGNRRQMELDAIRRRDIQNEGWLVITVTASQLLNPANFIRSVETALILRRAQLGGKW